MSDPGHTHTHDERLRILRAVAEISAHGPLTSTKKLLAERAYRRFRERLMAWILFDELEKDGAAESLKTIFLARAARLWEARQRARSRRR